MDYTDLVLADIKHMNPQRSLELVGVPNDLNLANISLINQKQIPIWIRYVVVPGWTDGIEEVEAMAAFIAPLSWVKRVDLLPYHSLGRHKWDILGLPYELEELRPPPQEKMLELKQIVEERSKKEVIVHD
ncbi:MAG: hypothetical protein ACOX0N_11445 [Syntrophomonadaceae bacterium]